MPTTWPLSLRRSQLGDGLKFWIQSFLASVSQSDVYDVFVLNDEEGPLTEAAKASTKSFSGIDEWLGHHDTDNRFSSFMSSQDVMDLTAEIAKCWQLEEE